MPQDSRRFDRLLMPRPVLTVTATVARLPVSDAAARRWLRERRLIRRIAGRDCVLWEEVIAAIQAGDEPTADAPSQPAVRLVRTRLEPLN